MMTFSKHKNVHTDIGETEQNARLTDQDNPYREAEIISEVSDPNRYQTQKANCNECRRDKLPRKYTLTLQRQCLAQCLV